MSMYYYKTDNGQRIGPVTSKQLRDLARVGTLRPGHLLQRDGSDSWVPASKVKGLFAQQAMTEATDTIDSASFMLPELPADVPIIASAPRRRIWLWALAIGVPVIAIAFCGIGSIVGGAFWWKAGEQRRLERQVIEMIAEKDGKAISRITLVKKTDKEYEGIVVAEDGREGSVTVVYDGAKVLARWQWRPGQAEGGRQPKGAPSILDDTSIVDFIDNTSSYKGRTVTIRLTVRDNAGGTSLRDRLGGHVGFYALAFKKGGARLDVVIHIPANLDVPNAKFLDTVVVTFVCNDGTLHNGNVATEIKR